MNPAIVRVCPDHGPVVLDDDPFLGWWTCPGALDCRRVLPYEDDPDAELADARDVVRRALT